MKRAALLSQARQISLPDLARQIISGSYTPGIHDVVLVEKCGELEFCIESYAGCHEVLAERYVEIKRLREAIENASEYLMMTEQLDGLHILEVVRNMQEALSTKTEAVNVGTPGHCDHGLDWDKKRNARDKEIERLRDELRDWMAKFYSLWINTSKYVEDFAPASIHPIYQKMADEVEKKFKEALSNGHNTPAISKTVGQNEIGEE